MTPSASPAHTSVHRVWKFGNDIDTDVLAPGAYMKLGVEGIAPHCLESVRPEFAAQVRCCLVSRSRSSCSTWSPRAGC